MKVSSIRWGVIWIGVGFFFLAINFQALDSLVFPRLFSLWPVLLIAIGVELIFRRTRLYFLALLSPILIAAAFVLAASYKGGPGWNLDELFNNWSWRYQAEKTDLVEIPVDDSVSSLDLVLNLGQAGFELKANSERMFSAETEYYSRSPMISHRTENGVEFVEYENRERPQKGIFDFVKSGVRSRIAFPDGVPLGLAISTELDDPQIDLSEFSITSLRLDLRSDYAKVRLGGSPASLDVNVSGRARKLQLQVPHDLGLEITGNPDRLRRALADVELLESPSGYRTQGFSGSPSKAYISIDARIDEIVIDRL
jgi:hypothetical protein